jgi:hypothetical protein
MVNESCETRIRDFLSTTGAPGEVRLPNHIGSQVKRQRFSAPTVHDEDGASATFGIVTRSYID